MQGLQGIIHRTILCVSAVCLLLPNVGAVVPASDMYSDTNTPVATAGVFSSNNAVTHDASAQDTKTDKTPQATTVAHASQDAQVIGALQVAQPGVAMVELHNATREFSSLDETTLQVIVVADQTEYDCSVALHGYIPPRSSVRYYHPAVAPQNTAVLDGCAAIPDGVNITEYQLALQRAGATIDRVQASSEVATRGSTWERKGWTAAARTGVFTTDFQSRASDTPAGVPYELPPTPEVQITEVLPHPKSCDEVPGACRPYIKLYNSSGQSINLAAYRLRSGDPNTRSTARNTSSLAGVIAPGQTIVIDAQADGTDLKINKNAGNLWLEDQYSLTTYPLLIDAYSGAGKKANQGKSWARNPQTNEWGWTTPNPSSSDILAPEPNNPTQPKIPSQPSRKSCPAGKERNPATGRCRTIKQNNTYGKKTKSSTNQSSKTTVCKAGYIRNPTTGRCRKITAINNNKQAVCKAGQYRNPATGRCRALAGGKTATVCKAGYYRNPATGRCKKLGGATRMLTPCKSGWERNPTTNRCRKVATKGKTPAVGYKVEGAQSPYSSMVWWATGGVGALALGYAGWEWRSEIGRWLRRVLHIG